MLRGIVDEIGAQGDEIIADLHVDGARYTLIRQPVARGTPLSPREREIARMVARGYTNKAIAAVLDISTWTVGTHIRRIFAKLEVHSRSAMVAHLVAAGEVVAEPEDWDPFWSRRK